MHNLALAHGKLGDHQAEHDMLQEALKKRRDILGADHPATLNTMHNLALAHGELGDHPQNSNDYGSNSIQLSGC